MPLLDLNNSNVFGNTGIVVEEPGEVYTDQFALETCTTVYSCPLNRLDLAQIPLKTSNPIFPWLYMERRRMRFKNGRILIAGEYAGINSGTTESVYELVIGVGEEPIETHPNFVVNTQTAGGDGLPLAGTPSAPQHGAIFVDFESGRKTVDDTKGVFEKFRPVADGGGRNSLSGVSAYLDASQVVWRETFMTTQRPTTVALVGRIQQPRGPVPSLGSGQNWLYVGLTYQERGIIFSVVNEWRASGRNGWNQNIYS